MTFYVTKAKDNPRMSKEQSDGPPIQSFSNICFWISQGDQEEEEKSLKYKTGVQLVLEVQPMFSGIMEERTFTGWALKEW